MPKMPTITSLTTEYKQVSNALGQCEKQIHQDESVRARSFGGSDANRVRDLAQRLSGIQQDISLLSPPNRTNSRNFDASKKKLMRDVPYQLAKTAELLGVDAERDYRHEQNHVTNYRAAEAVFTHYQQAADLHKQHAESGNVDRSFRSTVLKDQGLDACHALLALYTQYDAAHGKGMHPAPRTANTIYLNALTNFTNHADAILRLGSTELSKPYLAPMEYSHDSVPWAHTRANRVADFIFDALTATGAQLPPQQRLALAHSARSLTLVNIPDFVGAEIDRKTDRDDQGYIRESLQAYIDEQKELMSESASETSSVSEPFDQEMVQQENSERRYSVLQRHKIGLID